MALADAEKLRQQQEAALTGLQRLAETGTTQSVDLRAGIGVQTDRQEAAINEARQALEQAGGRPPRTGQQTEAGRAVLQRLKAEVNAEAGYVPVPGGYTPLPSRMVETAIRAPRPGPLAGIRSFFNKVLGK